MPAWATQAPASPPCNEDTSVLDSARAQLWGIRLPNVRVWNLSILDRLKQSLADLLEIFATIFAGVIPLMIQPGLTDPDRWIYQNSLIIPAPS